MSGVKMISMELSERDLSSRNLELAGLTSPEFREFLKSTIQAIARATKRSVHKLWSGLKGFFVYLAKKSAEGAEIHNRQMRMADDRFAKYGFYLRSHL